MRTFLLSCLAALVALLAPVMNMVTALWRFPWVRWRALPRSIRGPRFFTARTANAWQMFCGPLWFTVPMPYSRAFLECTRRSAPWLLPKRSGIRAALGLSVLALLLAPLTADAQVTATHAVLPGQPIPLAWDAPAAPTTGLAEDATAGYEVAVAQATQTGTGTNVFVKTWAVGNVTSFVIPAAEVPASPRPFYVSVRTVSVGGLKSSHSNSLAFRDPSAPAAPGSLRRPTAQ